LLWNYREKRKKIFEKWAKNEKPLVISYKGRSIGNPEKVRKTAFRQENSSFSIKLDERNRGIMCFYKGRW